MRGFQPVDVVHGTANGAADRRACQCSDNNGRGTRVVVAFVVLGAEQATQSTTDHHPGLFLTPVIAASSQHHSGA
jgi:hypothetical protein